MVKTHTFFSTLSVLKSEEIGSRAYHKTSGFENVLHV